MERIKIALIEDIDTHIKIVKTLLESEKNFELEIISETSNALLKLKEIKPHLILLDVKLSDRTGIEILKEIKIDESLKESKVIAFTSYAMKGDRERFLNLGFDGYIPKPLDTRNFVTILKEFLK